MDRSGEWDPRCEPPDGLVTPVGVGHPGGPTKGSAPRGRWRRTSLGLYVPSSVSDDVVEQRIVEQAARLPDRGAVTGWAALRLMGGAYFDGSAGGGRTRLPVPLAVGRAGTLKSGRGALVSREPLEESETHLVQRVRCTRPTRALFDEMRRTGDPRAATVDLDMAAAARLVAIWEMADYAAARTTWRRASVVAAALPWADERSRSPAESRMRLVWVLDAGLPPPLCNRPVFDLRGRHLGTPDLLDVETGVVGEYDGAVHLRTVRRARDIARECRFRGTGLEYFTIVGTDLHDGDLVVERMLTTRNRALSLDRPRGWTIEPPEGSEPDLSYGEELRLREWWHQQSHRDDV
jgi:hypothetical protein